MLTKRLLGKSSLKKYQIMTQSLQIFLSFLRILHDRVKNIIVIYCVDGRNSDRKSDCVRLLDIRVRVHPAGLLQVPDAAGRPQAPRGN